MHLLCRRGDELNLSALRGEARTDCELSVVLEVKEETDGRDLMEIVVS
jgi:hypothetical protein